MKKTKFAWKIPILIACILIFTQLVLADDIGLRVLKGNEVINISVEPLGTLTSPLRILKDGNIYGIELVDPGDQYDSGIRILTSSGVKALKKYVPLPKAYVSISMSERQVFRTWYTVTATVTVTENTASGQRISGVIVGGTWSGAYGGTVSGTTNANGQAGFETTWIGMGSTVTFTVNTITMGSNVYELAGGTSGSIRT